MNTDNMRPLSVDDLPYRFSHLDDLLDAAKIDILFATSKHNVRYLLGGYEFDFFSRMDAIGHSRYLPIFIYVGGKPELTAYIANVLEKGENENHPIWVPNFFPTAWTTTEAISTAIEHLIAMGVSGRNIGIEPSFFPVDAHLALLDRLPDANVVSATHALERLRAVKSEHELKLLREATDRISDAMVATIAASHAGDTKRQIIRRLQDEESARGIEFEYCLLTLGDSHDRAASSQPWNHGDVLSIDSGGNLHGYIGDICRMGVLGAPDSELEDLIAQVETVQQAAFSKARPGALGRDLIEHANRARDQLDCAEFTDFVGHGMGVITHEVPFLVTDHPVTYQGTDADNPLMTGMVLSIETTLTHPRRGFIKIEDTICVTENGFELFGAASRGWNRGGRSGARERQT